MQEVDNMMKTGKVKMEEVREENERLKVTLSQMMKDYQSLKKQFNSKIKEEDQIKDLAPMAAFDHDDDDDESELVSLSLGRFSGDHSMKTKLGPGLDWKSKPTQLSLNLKPGNESTEEGKNDVASRMSPKTSRSGDDILQQQQPALKKPRVSVRAVCNSQTVSMIQLIFV